MRNIIVLSLLSTLLFGCLGEDPAVIAKSITVWKEDLVNFTPQERERDKQRCIQYQKTGSCLEYIESVKWTGKMIPGSIYRDDELDMRRCWSLRHILKVHKNGCELIYD